MGITRFKEDITLYVPANTVFKSKVHFDEEPTVNDNNDNNEIGKFILSNFPDNPPTTQTVLSLLERLASLEKFLDRLGIDV